MLIAACAEGVDPPPVEMFWAANQRVLVDVASRPDYDNGGNYDNATYKVGLVLYALKVMGISSPAEAAMKARLKDAQWPAFLDYTGGLAHVRDLQRGGKQGERRRTDGRSEVDRDHGLHCEPGSLN